jgi:hypothetical protein
MSDTWDTVARELAARGPRRHADWDAELFETLASGPARALSDALHAEPRRDKVLAAWLTLAAEAVGLGYVDRASVHHLVTGQGPAPESLTLLGRCLVRLSLEQLPAYPADRAVALLARMWNLCEGLAAQPLWLNRYVASAAVEAPALEKLDAFLATTLEPALAPARVSTFSGPFTLGILDLREVADEFLPGEMHLAAPSVLCVHDRRAEDVRVGLFLAPGGEPRVLGLQPCLGPGPEETPPALELLQNAVRVNGREAALPLLGAPHRALAARSGFVVASAVDSQRLWVLETP